MNGSPPGARFRRDGFAPNCANFLAVACHPKGTTSAGTAQWTHSRSTSLDSSTIMISCALALATIFSRNSARRVSGGGPLSWPSLALELMADAPKAGVHGRVVRLEPIAEAPPQQTGRRAGRAAFRHVVLAIKKVGGVARVEHERLEAGERTKCTCRPFPSVPQLAATPEALPVS